MSQRTSAESSPTGELMKLDPAIIRRTELPNRDREAEDELKMLELRRSIRSCGGNLEPIKVRIRPGGADLDIYECVFGHRRMDACESLGLLVNAIVVRDMDDKAMLAERIAENRGRAEYTAIEQGRICLAALEAGHFKTQASLADELGLDPSQVSKSLDLARLPSEVLAAFVSTSELTYRDAKPLTDAVKRDREEMIRRANRVLAMQPRPKAKDVIKLLVATDKTTPVERFKTWTLTTGDEPFGQLQFDGKKMTITFTGESFDDAEAYGRAIESCYGRLRKKRSARVSRDGKAK